MVDISPPCKRCISSPLQLELQTEMFPSTKVKSLITTVAPASLPPSPSSPSSASTSSKSESSLCCWPSVAFDEAQLEIQTEIFPTSMVTTLPISTTLPSSPATSSSESSSLSSSSVHCKWTNCDWPGAYDDLVDHIREIHVELQPYHQQPEHNWYLDLDSSSSVDKDRSRSQKEKPQTQYVCLWQGCKVYGKGSSSRSWLERHVLQHSGPRPFKCIVEGCGQRFKIQSALERHVNSHFNSNLEISSGLSQQSFLHDQNSISMDGDLPAHATMMRAKSNDTNGNPASANSTPSKTFKRKKSATKIRKRCIIVKGRQDVFDEGIMEQLRFGLVQLNAHTGLDISGTQSNVTFRSKVIARRKGEKGDVQLLLRWEPFNILPDAWVPESAAIQMSKKVVSLSSLPADSLAQLVDNKNDIPKVKQRRK